MAGSVRTIYAAVLCWQRAVTPQADPVLHARSGGGGAEMSNVTAYMQRSGNSGRDSSFDKSGSYILGSVYLQIRCRCQRGQWHQKQALFEVFERVATLVLPSEMKWSQSTRSSDSPIRASPPTALTVRSEPVHPPL